MTAEPLDSSRRIPTREECIAEVAEIYDGILSDPVRAAEIRAHMAKWDAEHPDQAAS